MKAKKIFRAARLSTGSDQLLGPGITQVLATPLVVERGKNLRGPQWPWCPKGCLVAKWLSARLHTQRSPVSSPTYSNSDFFT